MAGTPERIGRTLGIGMRLAGRMAAGRVAESAQGKSPVSGQPLRAAPRVTPQAIARAAVRGGGGGFLRSFRKTGGLLWLEVTGFFFGIFAVWGLQLLWQRRGGWASGPEHAKFLGTAVLTALFGYLCVSSFWRARLR